ncbi:MAG: hypothetical protein L6Q83_00280 [Gammaproteobacteria bacterium]|nr:hypothetical protein [Gammaproteobacteria bacterium]MCK6425880.1 hypothetical protein [Burkholderiaceae bacterium]
MSDPDNEKARGLQMLEDRLGLVIPEDDPMATAAAQNELSLSRLFERLSAESEAPQDQPKG